MEISDIMIGNWVTYKSQPHKIIKIIKQDVVLDVPHCSDNEDYIIANINNCQPTELTKEILVDYGFFEAKDKYVIDDNNKEKVMIVLAAVEGGFKVTIGLTITIPYVIKYVHQLQQLLKVFGHSTTFNLNKCSCEYNEGNYVIYNDEYYRVDNVALNADNEYVFKLSSLTNDVDRVNCKYDDFEPIKVNAEELVHNKFKLVEGENVSEAIYTTLSEGEKLDEETDKKGKFNIVFDVRNSIFDIVNYENGERFNGTIQYFHQLQNVLVSMGIDFVLTPYSPQTVIAEMLDEVYK